MGERTFSYVNKDGICVGQVFRLITPFSKGKPYIAFDNDFRIKGYFHTHKDAEKWLLDA